MAQSATFIRRHTRPPLTPNADFGLVLSAARTSPSNCQEPTPTLSRINRRRKSAIRRRRASMAQICGFAVFEQQRSMTRSDIPLQFIDVHPLYPAKQAQVCPATSCDVAQPNLWWG